MIKVLKENDYGFNVLLLEYDGIQGFINLSELYPHGNKKKKKKAIKENDVLPVVVLKVDEDKQYIDLSKKRLPKDNLDIFLTNYKIGTNLNKMGKEMCVIYNKINNSQNKEFEYIMENTIWRLFEELNEESSDKIYNKILENPKLLFNETFDIIFINNCVDNLNKRITKNNMILQVEIFLLVTSQDGIELIKELLGINLDETSEFTLTIIIDSPPIYTIKLEGPEQQKGENLLLEILDIIKKKSENKEVDFSIKNQIKLIKPTSIEIKFLTDFELETLLKIE
ncbi:Translation initiation factor eIF-2 alpha [uncultured virus]|nr:Translation initiation factor eIF-2 alpha [uncultured virus]